MRVITLTTDFGVSSPYVAAMKGVILDINPEVMIVDVTHAIAPQDVRQGALVLAEVCHRFPADTIHVAVVDPGVGTQRKILFARIGDQDFIAPDNGLLSAVMRRTPPRAMRQVMASHVWLSEVSATFHGRDIMAPVAAQLSLGFEAKKLGPPVSEMVGLDWPEVHVQGGRIEGSVASIDSFGNLITDITAEALAEASLTEGEPVIGCGPHRTRGIYRTYGDQPQSSLIAVVGSGGYLELAVVGGNASKTLEIEVGAAVTVASS